MRGSFAGKNRVTAIICQQCGSPDVPELEGIQYPVPGDDEILVQVHAVAMHSSDWLC